MPTPVLRYSPGGPVLRTVTPSPSVTTFTAEEDEESVNPGNPTPILDYTPSGGAPVPPWPPAPEDLTYPECGTIQLIDGQSWIDVTFAYEKPDTNWIFEELQVVNTTDSSPFNIWPGIVTVKSVTGFRLQLNGLPDTDNYFLHWAVGGCATSDWVVSSGAPSSGGGGGGGAEMTVIDVAYSATVDTDASDAADGGLLIVQVGTLTGDIILANPTNPTNRQRLEYVLEQDATGDRALTLDSQFRIPSSSSLVFPVDSSSNVDYAAADAKTRLMAEYDEADDKWDVIAFVPGY